jgi:serine/threonine protein kinase
MSSEDERETPTATRDQPCSAFAKALKAGERPSMEDYLAQVPNPELPELLAKLVREEHAFRWKAGELPTLAEYKARFPNHGEAVERAFFTKHDEGGVRYALVCVLAKGGQGTVYRAKDNKEGDAVAIKVMHQETQDAVKRFKQEARLLKKAKHPLVVSTLDDFERGGRLFIVMEYIAGPTLAAKVQSDGPFTATHAARLVAQVAEAIDHVHRKTREHTTVVHRDLKPANIILDHNGDPHILDFGLACLTDELMGSPTGASGTLEYMSPEQATVWRRGRGTVDTRSDVWALGAILYELLTGTPPFGQRPNGPFTSPKERDEANDQFLDPIERQNVSCSAPKDLNTGIPSRLDEITRKALRKDPNERFQSANELAQALCEWLESTERIPPPWDFSAFLREKLTNFSNRPWLFDEVDAWPHHGNERVLLITGDLGTGKSAFVADLIRCNPHRRVLAWHFCQHDTPETLRPACFVRNLAGMLCEKLEGYRESLSDSAKEALSRRNCEADPASAFELGVLAPLNTALGQGDDVRYIVIDALDESLGVGAVGPTIVDLLSCRVARVPRWLRLIATTRRDPEVLQHFSAARTLSVDGENEQHADDVDRDVRQFMATRLNEPTFRSGLRKPA